MERAPPSLKFIAPDDFIRPRFRYYPSLRFFNDSVVSLERRYSLIPYFLFHRFALRNAFIRRRRRRKKGVKSLEEVAYDVFDALLIPAIRSPGHI